MQLLAIETSTDACSVALYRQGEIFVSEAIIPQQHSQRLLPMVAALLSEGQTTLQACDAIAFGCGPGSFTGVRMAAGVAQGLAFGVDIPVIPISTLAAIAWSAQKIAPNLRYVATLDARMQELYWALYEVSPTLGLVECVGEQVSAYSQLLAFLQQQSGDFVLCGPGWPVYAKDASFTCVSSALPQASAIAELAAFQWAKGSAMAPELALPLYVRDNVAVKSSK